MKYSKKQIKANRQKWIDALRSSSYRQTIGTLKRKAVGKRPTYCCLGVACALAVKEGIIKNTIVEGHQAFGKETATRTLPDEVINWLRLPCENPTLYYKGRKTHCAGLNDNEKLTFKQIADVIENDLFKRV